MIIKIDLSALKQVTITEYATRFLLGGSVCVITGLIAARFGPAVGGSLSGLSRHLSGERYVGTVP